MSFLMGKNKYILHYLGENSRSARLGDCNDAYTTTSFCKVPGMELGPKDNVTPATASLYRAALKEAQ